MTAIIAARLRQEGVVPFGNARQFISVRPVECGDGNRYGGRRSRRVVRVEPAASLRKRLFDIVAAGGALLFFAPVLIAIAVVIKLTSPGPVLFFQYRYGYRNRRFKIYKFRSMQAMPPG